MKVLELDGQKKEIILNTLKMKKIMFNIYNKINILVLNRKSNEELFYTSI